MELAKTSLLHLLLHIPRCTGYILQIPIRIQCDFFSTFNPESYSLDKMASNPPGACCATGFKHEGTPVGEVKNISGGMSRYRVQYSAIQLVANSL